MILKFAVAKFFAALSASLFLCEKWGNRLVSLMVFYRLLYFGFRIFRSKIVKNGQLVGFFYELIYYISAFASSVLKLLKRGN